MDTSQNKLRMLKAMQNLDTTQTELSCGMDAVTAGCNIESFPQPVMALFMSGVFLTQPITSLSDLPKCNAFSFLFLLPRPTAEAVAMARFGRSNDLRRVEEAMGADPRQMSRVNTSVDAVTVIEGMHSIRIWLANIVVFVLSFVDGEGQDRDDAPLVIVICRMYLKAIGSLRTWRRLMRLEGLSEYRHIKYTITSMIDTSLSMILVDASRNKALRAVASGSFHSLGGESGFGSRGLKHAKKSTGTIEDFGEGGELLKSCEIYENSKYPDCTSPLALLSNS